MHSGQVPIVEEEVEGGGQELFATQGAVLAKQLQIDLLYLAFGKLPPNNNVNYRLGM